MKKTLILKDKGITSEELAGKVIPTSNILKFRVLFMNNDDSHRIQKVEVRNINFLDLMRHLKRGESVCITPELLGESLNHQKEDRTPWHIDHI